MRFGWYLGDKNLEKMDLLPSLAEVRIDVGDIGAFEWQVFLSQISESEIHEKGYILHCSKRKCGEVDV